MSKSNKRTGSRKGSKASSSSLVKRWGRDSGGIRIYTPKKGK